MSPMVAHGITSQGRVESDRSPVIHGVQTPRAYAEHSIALPTLPASHPNLRAPVIETGYTSWGKGPVGSRGFFATVERAGESSLRVYPSRPHEPANPFGGVGYRWGSDWGPHDAGRAKRNTRARLRARRGRRRRDGDRRRSSASHQTDHDADDDRCDYDSDDRIDPRGHPG